MWKTVNYSRKIKIICTCINSCMHNPAVRFLMQALACNRSLPLKNVSFTANCFRRTEVKYIKTCTLARVWRQRCSGCHNCSEHNVRNCPVSGKITPAEVAVSSLGSACVPEASAVPAPMAAVGVAPAPAGLFQLPSCLAASLLKWPFLSAANATSERSVSQRVHRKRYGTFTLRNARLYVSCRTNTNHYVCVHELLSFRVPFLLRLRSHHCNTTSAYLTGTICV